jgi:segregation and condensation protein B
MENKEIKKEVDEVSKIKDNEFPKIEEEKDNSKIRSSESEQEKGKEPENSEEELKEDKNLVNQAINAMKHISSETAQEMDENTENENMKKVEAALFIAGKFLTLQELVMLTDINPLMIKEILEKLIEKYNDNSGIEIIEKSESWKMDVRQEHVSMINKLATGSAEFSKAEQETLAVIAYKQPIKQSVIIKIRGNKAYDHIKHFIDIDLVQAKKSGRTRELKLSDDFYEYFHLKNQKEIFEESLDSRENEKETKEEENNEKNTEIEKKENIITEQGEVTQEVKEE